MIQFVSLSHCIPANAYMFICKTMQSIQLHYVPHQMGLVVVLSIFSERHYHATFLPYNSISMHFFCAQQPQLHVDHKPGVIRTLFQNNRPVNRTLYSSSLSVTKMTTTDLQSWRITKVSCCQFDSWNHLCFLRVIYFIGGSQLSFRLDSTLSNCEHGSRSNRNH